MNSKKDSTGGFKRVSNKDCRKCKHILCCAIGALWYAFPTIDSVIWGEGKGCPADWLLDYEKEKKEEEKQAQIESSNPTHPTASL